MKKTIKKICCGILLTLLFFHGALAEGTENILFVCGGNTGRSPLAENLANFYFDFPEYGYEAFSRGVNVNSLHMLPEENAVTVMQAWNPNSLIEDHRATPINVQDIDRANIILTMTAAQKAQVLALYPKAFRKIFMLSQCANGTEQDVSDMYGHDLSFYQSTAKQIADYLELIKRHGFQCHAA